MSLGRSSVAGGCSLFLPCLRALLPFRARNLRRFSYATAARPRTNALTLDAVREPPKTSRPIRLRRWWLSHTYAYHLRRVPSLSGSPGFALPAVARAPPRKPYQTRRARNYLRSDARTFFRLPRGQTCGVRTAGKQYIGILKYADVKKTKFSKVKGIGLMVITAFQSET